MEDRKPKYKVGDKVKLNVGGPDMAVLRINIDHRTDNFSGHYSCQWFAGKKLDEGKFVEESLIPVENNTNDGA